MCISRKFGIAGIIIGVASLAYTFYVQRKVDKITSSIDMSVDKLSKGIDVDISQTLIDNAVDKAVEREVDKSVRIATVNAVNEVRDDIRNEVKKAVNASYSDVRSSVSDEVVRQVSNLDIDKLKYEVKEKAKDAVLKKFDANLDGLLLEFNQSLSNVRKIYDNIADSMGNKKASEMVFKIGG